ncbi:hypothetical protein [Streptomyces sp. TLI_105]|uniref:hypothetical protein n=1 Tax=Streptomyces sp. TLI_105 TaxID=1881019 RepID=UPI000899E8C0|nr:hypothetical protein [Streptomyces sp. TLI_105]SED48292.1 hypothetical protein SAMN05428939_5323 [Streptomyces sp. TLI_105]
MYGRKRAAGAVLAVGLGVAGCGAGDTGTGASAPVPPRPAGTGPLAKEVVRADFDGSVADAGVPPNAPEYGETHRDAAAGSRLSCTVAFKGFGTEDTPVDLPRYRALVGELRERGWRKAGDGRGQEVAEDGTVHVAQEVFEQRGWTLVSEHRPWGDDGVITLLAFDDACMKKAGGGAGPE